MALIGPPPGTNIDATIGQGWQQYMDTIYRIVAALSDSGLTANRPTKFLWVGRPFFDTTLGRPIWYNGTIWVDSSGAPA